MNTVFRTDRGQVRSHNEDYGGIFTNDSATILAVVADGVGGHLAGDVASRMASDLLQEKWETAGEIINAEAAEQWLKENIQTVNEQLYRHANEHEECQGMGTTVVAVLCNDKYATIAHVGDSRCYMNNETGFSQLTEDHSLVNELVKSGQISKEDAEHHPRKNVLTRALGTEPSISVDIKTITFEENDILLLCSDGLTNKISDAEIFKILSMQEPLEYKADHLVEIANHNGGEDNITLAILQNVASKEGV